MNAADLIAAQPEKTFDKRPEDAIRPIDSASDLCGWLDEIFISIRREAEGKNCRLRIGKLAAAGAYLTEDVGNYFDCRHGNMFGKLR